MEGPFLTVRDISDLLKVHPQTVRAWCRSGELESVLIADKTGYRIAECALREFLLRRGQRQRRAAA